MLHDKRFMVIMALIIAILFTVFFSYAQITLADKSSDYNVVLYIHGEKSRGGPIFDNKGNLGEGLWAPGYEKTGIIRIYNNYSDKVKVVNLGLTMELDKRNRDDTYSKVTDNSLYEKFAKNMELTIKKSNLYILKSTVYEESFFEMLYEKDNPKRQGFNLSSTNSFNIAKGSYVDLEYTVKMSEEAGNDMQGLKATVAFLINSRENPESSTPLDKDEDIEDIIEVPDEIIPDASGHWAHDCIITLLDKGIITGYEDGTIRPDNYITRLEAAVLVSRALNLRQESKSYLTYKDKIPEWSQGYVAAVTKEGIFTGYSGRKFMAYTNITREQMATVLARAFLTENDSQTELKFSDKDKISHWALNYVKKAVDNKAIEGYPDGTFKPKNNITRAETFTIICKLLEYHQEH